ncbi:MAG TPA: hypothetical protein VF556_12430 [Pyrinomonadaceae bacterium]|jgi:hypothetical protein
MRNSLSKSGIFFSAFKQFIFFTAFLLAFCFIVNAQTGSVAQIKTTAETNAPGNTNAGDETQTRVKQLEAQMQMMQAEIEQLKKHIVKQQPTQPSAAQTETKPASKEPNSVAAKPEIKTTETINTEAKQTAQPKQLGVDIGSARLTPYGTIYFNAFGNSGGTNNSDVPLFATPTGTGNASATVRQTRLGARVEGARVGNARLSAIVEADFFGGFSNIGIGENFGVVRLRLANARLDWEKTSVTIGQDWMVFAPVNPTSIAAAAIPQMAAAGNPWARLPQVKIERKLGANFTVQGAVLAAQTGDYPTASNFFLQPTSGAASRTPFFQSRIAFADKNFFGTKKAGSIGLSGHFGQSRVFTEAANDRHDVDSVGVALDWNIPLSEQFNLAGEAFFGRNLGGFQAGVFQSINTDSAYRQNNILISGGVRSIGTRGGWTQLGFTPKIWKNRFSILGSIGIDDPRDEDLTSLTRRDFRSRNLVFAFDLIYRFTPQFQVGAEFRRFQTDYLFSGRQNSNHVNLGAAYSF